MFFQQYYLECLSHASYLIGDTASGRAVVVDPQRDVAEYLTDAAENGLTITHVIETHFHADFLSGHLELARATGASIVYGRAAAGRVEFPITPLGDGDHLSLGEVDLEIRETPGHTPESISVVVREHGPEDHPWGVLTGDTLFIGDVGRPDLLASVGFTAEDLARQLYHSLHDQAADPPRRDPGASPPTVPARPAGRTSRPRRCPPSANSAAPTTRSAPMAMDDFVEAVTEGQSVAPLYFAFAANSNREEHDLLVDGPLPVRLSLDEALAHQARRGRRPRLPGTTPSFAAGPPARLDQRGPRRTLRRVRRRGHGARHARSSS